MDQSTNQIARRALLISSAIALALAVPAVASAQQAPAKDAGSSTVTEVVVTAQKRAQNLQAVPISAQVVTGQTLALNNDNNLVALSNITPGLDVAAGAGTTKLYVRGVGSGTNSGFDQAVGTFVDDIFHGRSVADLSSLLDVDRVEVLKGPQSTYFGNNAIAGAINIVTNKSDQVYNGYVRALYGSYGQYAAEGAVGGPITDTFGFRVAAMASGGDGWIKDVTSGQTVPATQSYAGRLTLTWAPTQSFDSTLKVEANHLKQTGDLADQIDYCPAQPQFTAYNGGNAGFCGAALAANIPTNNLSANKQGDASGEMVGLNSNEYVFTANYHKWGNTFTSVTGYYDYNYEQYINATASAVMRPTPATGPGGGIGGNLPEEYHQFSQEFRVTSPQHQTIEYLAGLYYQTDHLNLDLDLNFFAENGVVASHLPPLAPYLPLGQSVGLGQNESDYAAFGSVTWNVTDALKITGGLRYSVVDKNYNWDEYYGTVTGVYAGLVPLPNTPSGIPGHTIAQLPGLLGLGIPGTQSGSRNDHALLPSALVQYQVAPHDMVYVSYAEGFLAGGFNGNNNNATGTVTASPSAIDFAPEHVDAYEAGIKSQWFDNRVLLDLAIFRSNYQNLQVTVDSPTSGGSFVSNVTNAAASVAQGVEFDGQWVINDHFRISADGSYTDSHYVNYTDVGLTQAQTLAYDLCLKVNTKIACAPLGAQSLSGSPTIFAPKWNGALTGAYQTALSDGFHLTAEATVVYKSSYFLEATDDPLIEQPASVRLDARLGLDFPDRHWAFDIIGKNLTDANIRTFGSPLSGSLGSVIVSTEAPRTFAAQLRYKW